MSDDNTYTAKIMFINGTERSFEFLPIGDEDPHHYFRRLNEMHEAGDVVLEFDDKVITLVKSSILSIDVTPKPKRIPKNAIKVFRELSD